MKHSKFLKISLFCIIILQVYFTAPFAAYADYPPDLQTALTAAQDHAANPTTDWIPGADTHVPPDTAMVLITTEPDVGSNPFGLQYDVNENVVVRTATKQKYWLTGTAVAGQTYTIPQTTPAPSDGAWVTTGNEFTKFYDANGGGATGTDLIKVVEKSLGINDTATHDAIVEYTVIPNNDYIQRPTKLPDITTYSTDPTKYGSSDSVDFTYPSGMDPDTFNKFKDFYNDWNSKAYGYGFPWTQLGYTYYWGPDQSTLHDIQGLSEFVLMYGVDVDVYGIYTTQSYIYTKNDGTNLSNINPTDQYGNGFASFEITGACDSIWAGHAFQTKTKADPIVDGHNQIIIDNGGSVSGGQGILVWSLNYDVIVNAGGVISGPTTNKYGIDNTSNIAVLFMGNTTHYSDLVPVPGGENTLTNAGMISSPGVAIKSVSGPITITNNTGGVILGSTAIEIDSGYLIIDNEGGTISGDDYAIAADPASVGSYVTINGGEVDGKIILSDDYEDHLYVNDTSRLGFYLTRTGEADPQVIAANVALSGNITIAPFIRGTENIRNGEKFLIIDALSIAEAGGTNITVEPDILYPMITGFTSSIEDGDTKLYVTATRNNSYYAQNCGNASLGSTLDGLANNDSGDMADVIGALDASGNAGNAQQLQPCVDNGALQTGYETMNQFINTVIDHVTNTSSGISTGDAPENVGVWAQGFDTYLHEDPRGTSNGYNANVWGASLGYDVLLLENLTFGLNGGYARGNIRTKDFSARTDADNYEGSLYASYVKDSYYLDGIFSFSYNQYDSSRHVTFGAIDRTPKSNYGGQQYSGYLEGGYTFRNKKIELTPLASMQYMHLHINDYNEEDAGDIDLKSNAQDYNLFQTGLGARLAYRMKNKDYTIVPDLHAKWLYDWIGDNQQSTSTFTAGGSSFATSGFTPAQSSYDLGAKLTLITKSNITLSVNYDFEIREDFYSHAGYADLRYDF